MSSSSKKIKVLFVCLGNICRSPMAESVFRNKVNELGRAKEFEIESAGTASYHIGEWPDNRTIKTLKNHGITNYSKARQVNSKDLSYFDYILVMDHNNLADMMLLKDESSTAQVDLFRKFDSNPGDLIVPDPYYGGNEEFENVYDLVDRCSIGFLKSLK